MVKDVSVFLVQEHYNMMGNFYEMFDGLSVLEVPVENQYF